MSSAPNRSIVAATICSQSAGFATSAGTTKTGAPPCSSISAAAWVSVASLRPAIATRAPQRAKARATAKPTPVPPPVTIATLPANSATLIPTPHPSPVPQAGEGARSLLPLAGEGGAKRRMRARVPPQIQSSRHRLEALRQRADLPRRLDVEIGDLHAGVMGAERERDDVVRVVELRMMVHHLGLDRDLDDEGDRIAERFQREGRLDVGRLDRPVRQVGQSGTDLVVAQNFVMRHDEPPGLRSVGCRAFYLGWSSWTIACSSGTGDTRIELVQGLLNSRMRKIATPIDTAPRTSMVAAIGLSFESSPMPPNIRHDQKVTANRSGQATGVAACIDMRMRCSPMKA